MPETRCRACGGTYLTTTPDGSTYCHVCPPLARHELVAQLQAGTLVLSAADTARLEAARARDVARPPAADELSQVDSVLADLVVLRAGHRDENLDVAGALRARQDELAAVVADRAGRAKVTTVDVPMRAEGAGVDVLPDTDGKGTL